MYDQHPIYSCWQLDQPFPVLVGLSDRLMRRCGSEGAADRTASPIVLRTSDISLATGIHNWWEVVVMLSWLYNLRTQWKLLDLRSAEPLMSVYWLGGLSGLLFTLGPNNHLHAKSDWNIGPRM